MTAETLQVTKKADPREGRMSEIKGFYDLLYQNDFEDSPEQSRVSIATRTYQALQLLPKDALALDVGSGIQVTQNLYKKMFGMPAQRLITMDFAEGEGENPEASFKKRLLAPEFEHVIANGKYMPFSDEAFSLLVSNMALDFMPVETLSEIHRILKPDAKVILNMHHPNLIPEDLNKQISKFERKMEHRRGSKRPLRRAQIMRRAVLNQMKALRDEGILYDSAEKITGTFEPLGFSIDRLEEVSDGKEIWWEVEMTKTRKGVGDMANEIHRPKGDEYGYAVSTFRNEPARMPQAVIDSLQGHYLKPNVPESIQRAAKPFLRNPANYNA